MSDTALTHDMLASVHGLETVTHDIATALAALRALLERRSDFHKCGKGRRPIEGDDYITLEV